MPFTSPYQAAARAIVGHRLPLTVAATIADRVAEQIGQALDTGDGVVYAFPGPQSLAELGQVRGLSARKVDQLRALGAAAADGRLSTATIRTAGYDAARAALERLPGIGPFSSELVMLRGVGELDAFPRTELKFQRAMAAAYHLRDDNVDCRQCQAGDHHSHTPPQRRAHQAGRDRRRTGPPARGRPGVGRVDRR